LHGNHVDPAGELPLQWHDLTAQGLVGGRSRPHLQCDGALARTREYLHQRQIFGQRLASKQYVAFRVTELAAQVDLLRSHNTLTCETLMAGEDITRMAAVAKLTAGRLVREVADLCLQFHGGVGHMEETWTSRFFRDSRLASIGGGADEVMLQVLARLDGFPAS
jgi:citronellyl-CoA dehydrogenase